MKMLIPLVSISLMIMSMTTAQAGPLLDTYLNNHPQTNTNSNSNSNTNSDSNTVIYAVPGASTAEAQGVTHGPAAYGAYRAKNTNSSANRQRAAYNNSRRGGAHQARDRH